MINNLVLQQVIYISPSAQPRVSTHILWSLSWRKKKLHCWFKRPSQDHSNLPKQLISTQKFTTPHKTHYPNTHKGSKWVSEWVSVKNLTFEKIDLYETWKLWTRSGPLDTLIKIVTFDKLWKVWNDFNLWKTWKIIKKILTLQKIWNFEIFWIFFKCKVYKFF